MSLCLQHNKLFLKSSVCFSAYYSKWIPVRTKKPNKQTFFVCSYFVPSCMKNPCFAKCVFSGQEWQGEGSYLQAVFLRHWSLSAASSGTPSSSLCDTPCCHWAHLRGFTVCTSPPEHLCPGKPGQRTGWQRRVGLWSTGIERLCVHR